MIREVTLASVFAAAMLIGITDPAHASGTATWSGPHRSGSASWSGTAHRGYARPGCCYRGGAAVGAVAGLAVGTAVGVAAASRPAYVAPPPVVYAPPPVVYAAPPAVYAPGGYYYYAH
jgi:hypothetical protein